MFSIIMMIFNIIKHHYCACNYHPLLLSPLSLKTILLSWYCNTHCIFAITVIDIICITIFQPMFDKINRHNISIIYNIFNDNWVYQSNSIFFLSTLFWKSTVKTRHISLSLNNVPQLRLVLSIHIGLLPWLSVFAKYMCIKFPPWKHEFLAGSMDHYCFEEYLK